MVTPLRPYPFFSLSFFHDFNPLTKTLEITLTMSTVHLLDYVAGNVRSLVNAIEKLGFNVEWVIEPADICKAEV